MFDSFLNALFYPLLAMHEFYALVISAFLVSLLITIIYKYATDQKQMKYLKEKMKKYQQELKKYRKEPEKAMKINKKVMALNGEYMKHSIKATFYTFIPIIIFFGWMGAHFNYAPLYPNQNFNVSLTGDSNAKLLLSTDKLKIIDKQIFNDSLVWTLSGEEGSYVLGFNTTAGKILKTITITNKHIYKEPITSEKGFIIKVGNKQLKPMQSIPVLKNIPWINGFGWLGTYILFSIIFSMVLRKLMKLY